MRHEFAQNTDSQLLGSGRGAKVYFEFGPEGQRLAKKVFDPSISARLGYRFLLWKRHPYDAPYTDMVVNGAYELRRIAHRVVKAYDCDAEIVDATSLCSQESGFYTPYIADAKAYSQHNTRHRETLNQLEKHFLNIGLPVWSFGGFYKETKRKNNVLIGSDDKIYIIDYEAGWPFFDTRYLIGFDDVDKLRFQRFITLGKAVLIHRLGEKEYLELVKSWEKYQLYSTFWREEESAPIRKLQAIVEAFDWRSLSIRVTELLEEGMISMDEAEKMRYMIRVNHHLLKRILPHFLAHFSSLIFLRFPFGSIARPTYTLVMRGADELARLTDDKRRHVTQIHDIKVMVCSGIPIPVPPFSFFAYLTKALGEEPLSYLLLDNIFMRLSGQGLEEHMIKLGTQRRGKMLLSLKDSRYAVIRNFEQAVEKLLGQIVSSEVVGRSVAALTYGNTFGSETTRQNITRELVLATAEEIDNKYADKFKLL